MTANQFLLLVIVVGCLVFTPHPVMLGSYSCLGTQELLLSMINGPYRKLGLNLGQSSARQESTLPIVLSLRACDLFF